MDVYLKAIAGVLIAVILGVCVSKYNKDISLLLSITVCSMVAFVAASFLQPITEFIKSLQSLGNLNLEIVGIILKAVGVGILSEVTCMICADSGNNALAKVIQLLSSIVILWLMLPLLTMLLSLTEEILGEL